METSWRGDGEELEGNWRGGGGEMEGSWRRVGEELEESWSWRGVGGKLEGSWRGELKFEGGELEGRCGVGAGVEVGFGVS